MGIDFKPMTEVRAFLENTTLYQEFQLEKEEILKHKWIESLHAGYDIGFDAALVDWVTKYRSGWRRNRQAVLMGRCVVVA